MENLSLREKAILAGLYLAKFDKYGLENLGFNSFVEAYNVIGFGLETKPMSIKNYRDEFDPYFPNKRQGWHNRPMRDYVKELFDKFNMLDLTDFTVLMKKIVYINYDIEVLSENAAFSSEPNNSFAKRLITGQAAENYFEENYNNIECFAGCKLENTTKYGVGFDFKLTNNQNDFKVIEVKGLADRVGGVIMTEKEYNVASQLKERYFLFVVKNFKKDPFHEIYQNPVSSDLVFNKFERIITQISWGTNV